MHSGARARPALRRHAAGLALSRMRALPAQGPEPHRAQAFAFDRNRSFGDSLDESCFQHGVVWPVRWTEENGFGRRVDDGRDVKYRVWRVESRPVRMQNEIDIIRDVSARLERANIAYMLTGSMAMNYYAQPRMTRDIDIVVALAPNDAETIARLFIPDYYVSLDAVRDSILNESMFNLVHQESVIKVDCIVRKQSPYRRAEFERRQCITIEDFSTWIERKEDLILSKLDWAKDSRSEIQLRDVKNLAATSCDEEYVHRWAKVLGVAELWRECRT